MKRLSVLVALILALAPFAARAAAQPVSTNSGAARDTQASAAYAPNTQRAQPDLISIGGGWVDFDKDQSSDPKTQSADIRLEYRWGHNFWGASNDWVDFQIHPVVGVEVSTRSQLYGFYAFAFDAVFWKHLVLTESESVGLWDSGDAKPLGSFIEFRSQVEAGWRFDNDMRLTAQISHISNAGIGKRNPGEEIIGGYLHVPTGALFGHH